MKGYILAIISVSVLCGVTDMLCPEGVGNGLKKALGFITALLMICVLANPVISYQKKVYTSRGTEIVFVIDTSPSMAALDIGTSNRLEAAKQAVNLIVENNSGSAFGLVAMASETVLLVPPTMDHEIFMDQVNSLQIGKFGEGTAIGSGITSAVYHLASSMAPQKAIIFPPSQVSRNSDPAIHMYGQLLLFLPQRK